MTTITIHYSRPANNPFKVPRPHRVDIDEQGEVSDAYGGDVGRVGYLLGFCRTVTPNVEDWEVVLAAELYDGSRAPEDFIGWYAQFSGEGEMFGYARPIERIEVTP